MVGGVYGELTPEGPFLVDSKGTRTPLPGYPIPQWKPAPPAIENLTFAAELPKCGRIVSMVEHQGVLMVATESGVWALHEGSFHPIRFIGETE